MPGNLDIQQVISRSTSQVALSDLTAKGFKQVKVLNQAAIVRLVTEVVESAIAQRASELSEAEKQKVIAESERKFRDLFQANTQTKSSLDDLQATNRALASERDRVQQSLQEREMQVRGLEEKLLEKESALARLEAQTAQSAESKARLGREGEERVASLTAAVAEKDRALATLEAQLAARQHDFDALQSDLAETHRRCREAETHGVSEAKDLQRDLTDREKTIARLEGVLAAKDEEIRRMASTTGSLTAKMLKKLEDKIGSFKVEPEVDQELRKSIEGIQRNIENLASGSAVVRKTAAADVEAMVKFAEKGADVSLESNLSKVGVEEKSASGVGDTLAKLKRLKEGAKAHGN